MCWGLGGGAQRELISLVLSSFIPKDSKDIPIYMVSEGGSWFALNHNRRDLKVRWEKHRLKQGVLGSRLNSDFVVVLG